MPVLYVCAPRPLLPVKNTDWLYAALLSRLQEFCPDLQTVSPTSLAFDVLVHARFGLDLVSRRTALPVPRGARYQLSQFFRLPKIDRARERAQAILCFERFPSNADRPVIWITGPTIPEKLRKRGWSEKQIQAEIDFKREASTKAAAIVLTTEEYRDHFEKTIRPTTKPRVVPFFIPFEGVSLAAIEAKWHSPQKIRLLFMGRAAHRKGLPLVLELYKELMSMLTVPISLHIVTSESDGPVEIPALPGITREREASRGRAAELMKEAHFALMPSSEESYGFVYIEAMASGAIPVAAESPVQREIFRDGRAGLLVSRDAKALATTMMECLQDRERTRSLVAFARELWEQEYAPAVVSRNFCDLVDEVVSRPAPVDATNDAIARLVR